MVARVPMTLVVIDSTTKDKLGDPDTTETVRRGHYSELLDGLARAGARVVILDVFFRGSTDDDELVKGALRRVAPMPVIVPWEPADTKLNPLALGGIEASFKKPYVTPLLVPEHVRVASTLQYEPDASVHGFPLFVRDKDSEQTLPHAALEAFLALNHGHLSEVSFDAGRSSWRFRDLVWPAEQGGQYRTTWIADPAGIHKMEFAEALSALGDPGTAKTFAGQVVIVADSTEGARSGDMQATPIGMVEGGMVLAHFINSLASPSGSQATGTGIAVTFLAGAGLSLVLLSLLPLLKPGPLVLAVVLYGTVLATVPSVRFGAFGSVALVPLAMAGLVSALVSFGWVGVRRTHLLDRYLPRYVKEDLATKGERLATVLFVDMKGSTKSIRGRELDEAATMLASALKEILQVVPEHGGHVEVTMGDGAMAMFYFDEHPDADRRCLHAMHALRSASVQASPEFRKRFGAKLDLTMGAETGPVTGKIVKTNRVEEWSLFGMTIHLAARLQSACGDLGVGAVVGPRLHKALPDLSGLAGKRDLKGIGETEIFSLNDI